MYKVLIRPLEISDAEISWKWRNDAVIWKFAGSKPKNKITLEVELDWIKKVTKEENSRRFAILVDDVYVGNIQLTNIKKGVSAEYHIFIGNKDYWNKGIAKLATFQIITYAKNILKLKRLFLYVKPNHLSAIQLYTNCKFVKVSDEIKMELNLSDSTAPIVSIFCTVFNHESFIRECLEGLLNQKCNFHYEIVIGEDCSTDNSRKIILEYADKFPGKFKLLLHGENLGAVRNQKVVLENCSGKYVALCEGDDFWSDNQKLQRQFNFMEENLDFSICFHDVKIIENQTIRNNDIKYKKNIFDIYDLAQGNFMHTCSVFFRNRQIKELSSILDFSYVGDYIIYMLHSKHGKIKYINISMAHYRIHNGGTWSSKNEKFQLEKIDDYLSCLLTVDFQEHIKDVLVRRIYWVNKKIFQYDHNLKSLIKMLKIDFFLTVKIFIKRQLF